MIRTLTLMLTTVAAIAVAAGAAPAAETIARPGFAPGTWQGVGTISGTTVDGPMTTVFRGKVRFTLTVKPNLAASGKGTLALTMTGSGPVRSTLTGTAPLAFTGTGSEVRYSGTEKVAGRATDGTIDRPISFTTPVKGRLVISRAGSCKVVGSTPLGDPRVTLKWTATKGTGTCL